MSLLPAPWSLETTQIPRLLPWVAAWRMISPVLAWSTMLRAISEIAAAIRVRSEPSKPNSIASARPFCRASTMSALELIATRVPSFSMFDLLFGQIEVSQPFFKVEGSADAFQGQPQLHHGEGNIGLDADDDRFGATQFEHVRDGAEGAG